ncbi:MAG: hypothetical protein IJ218_06075 [Alphaproteobacteria bacterium]|nr:hypothetical protein [Alphaproteobacteria bacterium]
MAKKNYLQLINDGLINELAVTVFNTHLDDKSETTYTDVLTEDEEIALMQKTIAMTGHEADPWLEFVKTYNTKYPLCNKALDVLFKNADHPNSLLLLIALLSCSVYNEEQGIKLCNIMLQSQDQSVIMQLLQLLCECGRIFYPEVYRLLGKMDTKLRDTEQQYDFAAAYKQAVENYRKVNGLDVFKQE